jgi:transcriptional regulator with XRE-family HTH domain
MLTIKELREEKNMSQTDLAKLLDVSLRTVQNYEADQTKIPLNKLHNIYKVLNVDLSNNLFLKDVIEVEEPTGYYHPNVSAAAGMDKEMVNDELHRIPVSLPNWEKGIEFINVYGDSMYPKYNAGEIIGIKIIEFEYLNYGYPYVIIFENGDIYIKIVQPGTDNEHLKLESTNEFYKPKEFHKNQMKSFYSIKGVIKKEMM